MTRLIPIVLGLSVCSAVGYAYFQQQSVSKQLVVSEAHAITCPVNPTQSEVTAFATAMVNQQPLPSGWAIAGFEGKVTATDTGHVMQPSGERAWTVNVVDDQSDIDFAKLYIDSELVFTATRASGSILDRNGMSIATLPVLVPPPGESWTGRLEWTSVAGVTRSWTTAQ
jgi:hypothetical protein